MASASLVIVNDVPDLAYSSELDSFSIKVENGENWNAEVYVICNGETILYEDDFVPDDSNMVVVDELDKLLEQHLQKCIFAKCSITINVYSIDDGNISIGSKRAFNVMLCTSQTNSNAKDSIRQRFFSAYQYGKGYKITAPGRTEKLYFYDDSSSIDSTSYTAHFLNIAKGNIVTKVGSRTNISTGIENFYYVDVSPDTIAIDGYQLLDYSVECGDRSAKFSVRNDVETTAEFCFINAFGFEDSVGFTGLIEDNHNYERKAGYINGKYRNYGIDDVSSVTLDTGIISEAMLPIIDDLAKSREIYLLESGKKGQEVTITETDLKRTNEDDALFRCSITYKLARRLRSII